MIQPDRLFQFAAGAQISHDAWMRSMVLLEAGEWRPHFIDVSVGRFGCGKNRVWGKNNGLTSPVVPEVVLPISGELRILSDW